MRRGKGKEYGKVHRQTAFQQRDQSRINRCSLGTLEIGDSHLATRQFFGKNLDAEGLADLVDFVTKVALGL